MPSLPVASLKAQYTSHSDEVAGDRADHRRRRATNEPRAVGEQADPQQRQGEVVGQLAGVQVDEGERDHRTSTNTAAPSAASVEAEAPGDIAAPSAAVSSSTSG